MRFHPGVLVPSLGPRTTVGEQQLWPRLLPADLNRNFHQPQVIERFPSRKRLQTTARPESRDDTRKKIHNLMHVVLEFPWGALESRKRFFSTYHFFVQLYFEIVSHLFPPQKDHFRKYFSYASEAQLLHSVPRKLLSASGTGLGSFSRSFSLSALLDPKGMLKPPRIGTLKMHLSAKQDANTEHLTPLFEFEHVEVGQQKSCVFGLHKNCFWDGRGRKH